MFFFIVGATSAVDLNNVSNTENLNLMADDVDSISVRDNLEVPMGDFISQNNMVDSHENFSNYSDNSNLSSYENNYEDIHASDFIEIDNSKKSNLLSVSAGDNLISASSKISVKVTISKHTIKFWKNNNVLAKTKVSIKIGSVTYTKTTDEKGIVYLSINLYPGKHII